VSSEIHDFYFTGPNMALGKHATIHFENGMHKLRQIIKRTAITDKLKVSYIFVLQGPKVTVLYKPTQHSSVQYGERQTRPWTDGRSRSLYLNVRLQSGEQCLNSILIDGVSWVEFIITVIKIYNR